MEFDHLPKFTVAGTKSEQYGDAVKETATLLNRPYHQMHVLFTREKWTLEEIKRAYQVATKHNGNVTPEVAWWAGRKRRNGA